jgi:hypothetical protein
MKTPKALNMSAQDNVLGLQTANISKPWKGGTRRHVPGLSSAILVSVSPLTGLNGLAAVRDSRALPWPNMFDAFGVGEITVRKRIGNESSTSSSSNLPRSRRSANHYG